MNWIGDARFRELIDGVGAPAFDESRDVICGLWPDLTFAYFNQAWTRFAREEPSEMLRGRWALGGSVLEVCSPALRPFYTRAFREALGEGDGPTPTYVCPFPEANGWYAMRVLALQGRGLIVCHAPIVPGTPAASNGPLFDPRVHTTSAGLILQCFHCQRVRAVSGREPDRWDLIPALVKSTGKKVSGVLCPICLAYYYYRQLEPDDLRTMLRAALVGAKTRL
jgi:hypothetical protein